MNRSYLIWEGVIVLIVLIVLVIVFASKCSFKEPPSDPTDPSTWKRLTFPKPKQGCGVIQFNSMARTPDSDSWKGRAINFWINKDGYESSISNEYNCSVLIPGDKSKQILNIDNPLARTGAPETIIQMSLQKNKLLNISNTHFFNVETIAPNGTVLINTYCPVNVCQSPTIYPAPGPWAPQLPIIQNKCYKTLYKNMSDACSDCLLSTNSSKCDWKTKCNDYVDTFGKQEFCDPDTDNCKSTVDLIKQEFCSYVDGYGPRNVFNIPQCVDLTLQTPVSIWICDFPCKQYYPSPPGAPSGSRPTPNVSTPLCRRVEIHTASKIDTGFDHLIMWSGMAEGIRHPKYTGEDLPQVIRYGVAPYKLLINKSPGSGPTSETGSSSQPGSIKPIYTFSTSDIEFTFEVSYHADDPGGISAGGIGKITGCTLGCSDAYGAPIKIGSMMGFNSDPGKACIGN